MIGKKRTAREPLWKCRKRKDDVKTAGASLLRDKAPTKPVYGRSGIRHERWPELAKEAVERNVAHCRTEKQAQEMKKAIAARLQNCGLELHPEKTKIVYCKDDFRKGQYPNEKFDFLGYAFQPRRSKNRKGKFFINERPSGSVRGVSREWYSYRDLIDQIVSGNACCAVTRWRRRERNRLIPPIINFRTGNLFAKLLLFMRLNIKIARSLAFSCPALLCWQACERRSPRMSMSTIQPQNLPLKVGGDVTAPRAIYAPAPEYSEEARAAGHQGTCVLSLIVGADGKPRNVKVVRRLGMQLDEKAIEAVREWTFEPARKDGTPVAVQIKVEVSFRLYRNGEGEVLSPEMSEQMLEARSRAQSQIYRVSEGQELGACLASSPVHRTPSEPAVTVAELTFEGDLRMPSPDRDQIAASLKQRTYSGNPDDVASEIAERVKAAWQNSGYLKAQANTDARVLTSNPDNERIAVTVLISEGQQYRLEGIRFRNNRAITNAEALRNLFPLKDGDVFDRAAVAKGLENLRFAYGEMGYVNLTSVPDAIFNEENQTISLDIDLDEGKQFFVSRIDIVGLDESVFQNVLKDLFVKPGDIYNQRLVDLFLKNHASLLPTDASLEPRFNLRLNERAATVAITYDFRRCHVD